MSHLSLFSCGGTRIGDVDKRGISGGERKRVSIGCELLVNPSVLFVDVSDVRLYLVVLVVVVDIRNGASYYFCCCQYALPPPSTISSLL